MEDGTEGTRTLLGNQRKGVIALAIPIGVALLFQQLNNIVDSLWVSGLGGDALAALGIVYPIYNILIGIGNGLGIGVAAAIARSIGERHREDAVKSAGNGLTVSVVVGLALTPILMITAEPSMGLMGAGDTAGICLEYAYPIYISTVFIIMSGVMSGMLRGEGAAKRSMVIQVAGAMVNIVLDPVLIYTFGMGVAGAAWATVVAFVTSCSIAAYWYIRDNEMYVKLRRSDLRYDRRICGRIFSVGAPEAMELSIMYFFNIFLNLMVIRCGGTDAVGVYSTGWRVANFILIIAQAMGGALVAVCSAEYGMRRFDMISDALRYTVAVSIALTVVLSVVLALGSGFLASVFTQAEDLRYLHDDAVRLFRSFCLFLPVMSMVYTGSALLQAIDRATGAMFNSLARNFMLCGAFYVAATCFGTLASLWWAMTLCEIAGGIMMGSHAFLMLRRVSSEEGTAAPARSSRPS